MKNEAALYSYSVAWSPEDEVFIARVQEFSLLAAHGSTQEQALAELRDVVADVLKDLRKNGEPVPEPFSTRAFSGKLQLRMGPELHRRLALEAERLSLSLNQLITQRLSSS